MRLEGGALAHERGMIRLALPHHCLEGFVVASLRCVEGRLLVVDDALHPSVVGLRSFVQVRQCR